MGTRTTHTLAVLGLSSAAYQEIRAKLEAAGYDHAISQAEGLIDMSGIGVAEEPAPVVARGCSCDGGMVHDVACPLNEGIVRCVCGNEFQLNDGIGGHNCGACGRNAVGPGRSVTAPNGSHDSASYWIDGKREILQMLSAELDRSGLKAQLQALDPVTRLRVVAHAVQLVDDPPTAPRVQGLKALAHELALASHEGRNREEP